MKKKIIVVLMVFALCIGVLAACGGGSNSGSNGGSNGGSSGSSDNNSSNEAKPTEENKEEPKEEPKDKDKVEWAVGDPIFNLWTDSIGSQWIQVMVPVSNTGSTNLYFESATLDIEDESGHLIDTLDYLSFYPEVLQPGETGWVYEETTFEGDSEPENIIHHLSFSKAKVECIRFEVSDTDIKEDSFGDIEVTGRVENKTDKDETFVNVVALFYDAGGMLIGTAFDYIDVKAGEKIGFSASTFSMPDSVTLDAIAEYVVLAYPTQFQW